MILWCQRPDARSLNYVLFFNQISFLLYFLSPLSGRCGNGDVPA